MKIAYIAGPYRGNVEANIAAARAVAIKYIKLGYAVLCPHLNTAHMDGIMPDDYFLKADLVMMKRCDVVVAMSTWQKSSGAIYEIQMAEELEIPVIYDDGNTNLNKLVDLVRKNL